VAIQGTLSHGDEGNIKFQWSRPLPHLPRLCKSPGQ
jgi:hypothetical protein